MITKIREIIREIGPEKIESFLIYDDGTISIHLREEKREFFKNAAVGPTDEMLDQVLDEMYEHEKSASRKQHDESDANFRRRVENLKGERERISLKPTDFLDLASGLEFPARKYIRDFYKKFDGAEVSPETREEIEQFMVIAERSGHFPEKDDGSENDTLRAMRNSVSGYFHDAE